MKLSGGVAAVLVVIGIAIGFLVGRTTGSSSENSGPGDAGTGSRTGEMDSKSDRFGDSAGSRSGAREGSSGRSAAAAIRQVARELELSPMSSMDFDAMFEAYEAIRWMSPKDIRIALAELESAVTNPQIKMVIKMMLIGQWAKQDGQAAVEYAMQDGEAMTKTMGIMGGLMGWLKRDPEGAYAWYQDNQEELSKGGMMAGQLDGMILAALAQRDMPRAFEGLATLKPQAQEMALMVMGGQMAMDPVKREQYVRQLEGLEDSALRKKGLEGMIQVWAFQDPQGAAEFIDSRQWTGDTGQELRSRLTQSWAAMDAQAALTWRLETLGENENRGDAVAGGFAQWMTQDPKEAQEWLSAQPAEVRSDQLYQQTAIHLQLRNTFTDAVEWAGKIEDQTIREATMQQVYNTWNQQDQDAAQEWVGQLDAGLRERLESASQTNEVFPESTDRNPAPAAPR